MHHTNKTHSQWPTNTPSDLQTLPVTYRGCHPLILSLTKKWRLQKCSTISENRKVYWSSQHPSRTRPGRWRSSPHCTLDNLQQDLADGRLANPVDPVLDHHTSQERQPAAVPKLPNGQPHQLSGQSHAEDHTEQIEAASREDHCWRTGRLQSREHHRGAKNPLSKTSPAPVRPLPCFQLACSFVGNHDEVQHQHKPYPSHQKPL